MFVIQTSIYYGVIVIVILKSDCACSGLTAFYKTLVNIGYMKKIP